MSNRDAFLVEDEFEDGYFKIQRELITHFGQRLGPIPIALYNALKHHRNHQTGACFPSYTTLAEDIGASRDAAIDAMKVLITAGVVVKLETPSWQKAGLPPNTYRLPNLSKVVETEEYRQWWQRATIRGKRVMVAESHRDGGLEPLPIVAESHCNKKNPNKTKEQHAAEPAGPAPLAGKPEKKPRERNPLFDALVAICYPEGARLAEEGGLAFSAVLTKSEIGRVAKAVAELKELGVDPDAVLGFPAWWRRKYRDATLTPGAITGNWSDYRAASVSRERKAPTASPFAGRTQPGAPNAPESGTGKTARESLAIANPNIAKFFGGGGAE